MIAAVAFAAAIMCSCANRQMDDELQKIEKNQVKPSGIVIDYPIDSTLFPPEIAAPRFMERYY